jgi:hypothetical protein
MSESSFSGDNDLTAGATVESDGGTVDSATADQEAAYDDSVSSAAGNVTADDAVVASPAEDSAADETALGADQNTSHDADIASGYDEENPGTT